MGASKRPRAPWRPAIALVACGLLHVALAQDGPISPSVAALFVGEEKVVEHVTAAQRDGNTVRLRLGTPPQDLTVSLIIGMLSNYPPAPETYYLGKSVRVAGTIGSFRGTPEIVVHDPERIQVMGAGTAAAPAPPPGGTAVGGTAVGGSTVVAAPIAPAVASSDRPSAAPASAAVRGAEDVRQLLDALTERVRELERKVERLEHGKGE